MWWAKGGPGSDLEEHLAHLRDEGYCEEALAIERTECERQREDGRIERELWTIVSVFAGCCWEYAPIGLGGRAPVGISSMEILATCRLMRIPPREWDEVRMGVRWMVNAALPLLQPKEK